MIGAVPLVRRLAAELTGTAILVAVGVGAIVAGADAGGVPQWSLAVAWFTAVALPIQLFAASSGAHLNPVVTLALTVRRRFPTTELGPYVAAQLAGALAGALGVRILLGGGAHLGATIPRNGDWMLAVPMEFGFTCLLVLSVLYLGSSGRPASRLELLLPAAVVGLSTFVIGPWTGSSLNPARSLAPALLAGTYANLWVYVTAVPLGALAAGPIYDLVRR